MTTKRKAEIASAATPIERELLDEIDRLDAELRKERLSSALQVGSLKTQLRNLEKRPPPVLYHGPRAAAPR